MNSDGSENGAWSSDPEGAYYPDWSPAGGRVVFERGGPTDLWVTDGSSTDQLTFTPGAYEFTPVFSPNGGKFAYIRDARVWIMNGSGGNQHAVPHSGQAEGNPSWQPK